jgi:hypothetical protein
MRAYTPTYLGIFWLCGLALLLAACSDETGVADAGGTSQRDAGRADSGPMDCSTQGTWRVTLAMSSERCSPSLQASTLTITVDPDADAGADAFVTSTQPAGPFCTRDGRVTHEVGVAASGCIVTASSLTSWCAHSEPQCADYQLMLHVRGERAEVKGSYRSCWCGTAGPEGTTVQVSGSAVRE